MSRTKNTNMDFISFLLATLPSATDVPCRFGRVLCRSARPAARTLGAVGMLFAFAAFAQENGEGEAAPDVREYLVQPGDLLHISVWNEAGLDQDVLVRPDGGFSFPLAGDLSAIGKSVEDLRVEITERLERYIPGLVVTVSVQEINGNKIYVLGQVNNPGVFVMNPRIDVLQALSVAGGTTAFASTNDILIFRRENGTQVVLPFRLDQVMRGDNLEQNILLESGDIVVVP